MSLFVDLGRMGLSNRMKRLSQSLMSDTNALYADHGIDLEAAHFPYLFLVVKHQPMTLREIEHALGTTHAYISQTTKTLLSRGLITASPNPDDKRSKLIKATTKGANLVQRAAPLWQIIDRAMADLLKPHEGALFLALKTFESNLEAGTLYARAKNLEHEHQITQTIDAERRSNT